MTAIFKREFKSCFTGMIGWVIAAVSLFFLGLYFTNRNLLYASSDFASVLYTMTMIMLLSFWQNSLFLRCRWRWLW